MESFKANFLIFFFVVLVLGLAYWAMGSLQDHTNRLAATAKIEDVGPVIKTDPAPIDIKPEIPEPTTGTTSTPSQVTEPETPVENNTPTDTTEVNSKYASLIGELNGLIDDNILMKKGSRGTRVGTVQKFLIEYGVKMKVDNDYGDSTVTAVKKFQGDQKLSADGQAGPSTYQKMIEWLESN